MKRHFWQRLGLLILVASLVALATTFPVADWISGAFEWAKEHRVAASLLYLVFICLATVLFLPGSIAIMISGYLFGFLPGLLIAAIAVPVAAHCAFVVGRWVAYAWVQEKMERNPRLQAIETGLQNEAFLIVVLTRLSLIIPFNMLNYIYGASSVTAKIHFLATTIGMLPAVALYVYIGTLGHDLGQILSGDAAPSGFGIGIVVVGLLVIAFTTWVIHKAASRALLKQVAMFEQDPSDRIEVGE